jgi:RNA polymerase sigma-70 factor (ECF subfamily)
VNREQPCSGDELLTRALAGEGAAFGALVRRHQRAVYSLALRMLNDRYLAQDLAQEVFLQLHRKLADVQSDSHLSFWLRKVTLHRAIDQLRREPRAERASMEEAMSLAAETKETDPLVERQLRELVGRLSPPARAVVLLRYQEDLDPTEIARTLKMSLNTVKSHLKRSLACLREQIGETAAEQTLT